MHTEHISWNEINLLVAPSKEKVRRDPGITIPFPSVLGLLLRFYFIYCMPTLDNAPELEDDGILPL